MKTFTTQVSPHFHGPFLPSLVSLVTQFSTIQHSFQVPSEEPGPGVCQALCWAAVVRWPYQTGPLPKLIFNRKSSQRRGQLREGVQGECGSGKRQGGVRKQREQAGEGPEAEGTAQVEREQADEGPEAEGTAQVKGRSLTGAPSPLGDPFSSEEEKDQPSKQKGCRKGPVCPFCLSSRE